MKLKKWMAILFICALTLGITGCKSGSEETAAFPGTQEADTVVLDIISEPAELNHMLLTETTGEAILRHTMSGLARLDSKDNPIPDIAERWEANEDYTEHTVYLRKDATWSNGDPVTANDFYYSWITQMTPSTGSSYASFLYTNIENGEAFYNGEADVSQLGLEVVDNNTLKIRWAHPMTTAPFWFASPVYFPMNQKAYEEIGSEQYAKDAEKMVTNGAFTVTEWVHDDYILLEKNEAYIDADRILIPKIKLVMLSDDNTRLNAFKGGEVDFCSLYSEQIDEVKNIDEAAVQSYIDGTSWYLNFNLENEYLANVNFRKALAYALDTQSLLDNVIRDGSVAADGLVPHVIAGVGEKPYSDERGSLFAYDPETAKESFDKALNELGVTAEDITLDFVINDSSYSQTQAAYLQQQWKEKLGLDVDIRVLTWKARVEAETAGDYDVFVKGWGPTENDAMTFLEIFTSDSINNHTGFNNEEYDSLITAAKAESNLEERQKIMITAEKILMDDTIIGPMYFTSTTYATSAKLTNIARTPFQLFNLTDGASIADAQ